MIKKDCMVSVIIPTYNSAEYIREAVESVLSQTYSSFEIIVVNDGSTDTTDEVIKSVLDRIIYLKHENAGPAAARNLGIQHSKGEYIAFLDADDIWLPMKLEKQMSVFHENPHVALVYSKYVEFGNRIDSELLIFPRKVRSGLIFDELLVEGFVPLSTVMISKSVLEDVGWFDTDLNTAEDTNLFLRIAKNHSIFGMNEILGKRRKHSGNLSDSVDVEIGSLANLDRIVSLYPETDPKKCIAMKKAYIIKGTTLILHLFHGGKYDVCKKVCKRLIRDRMINSVIIRYFFLSMLPVSVIEQMRRIKRIVSKQTKMPNISR